MDAPTGPIPGDEPLPLQELVEAHATPRGIPKYGERDWNAYATLFNDVTQATDGPLDSQRTLRFSQRKALVDELWRLGYRREGATE